MTRFVIIGGGVMGCSTAYHLAKHPLFSGEITVIERDPSYTRASSALSASAIRVQFSTPINISLSQYGLTFLKRAAEDLAVGDDVPVMGLREPGYLYLVPPDGLEVLHEIHATQRAASADVVLLSPDQLRSVFPWLSTDGVAEGSFGRSGEGWFNGPGLLQALRSKARSLGVRFVAQAAVGFQQASDDTITGVKLADGSVLAADQVINAGGGWAGEIAAWAGIDLPIRPKRRMVFSFACRADLPKFPLLIDPSGVWVRPEGAGYICGFDPDAADDPDEPPLEIDEAIFNERIWPLLAERVPGFEELKLSGGWAGYYDYNLFDQNGVVGPHPVAPSLFHVAGFSGHGMQHSPGIGRGVAEMLLEGRYVSLDLSPLATDRLARGEKLLERCII